MTDVNLPDGHTPAVIALLTLHGSLPRRPRPVGNRYCVHPSTDVLSIGHAANVLAGLPKPLGCFASVADGIVHIHTEPLQNPEQLRQRAWRSQCGLTHGPIGQMIAERYGRDIDRVLVVWIGGGQQE